MTRSDQLMPARSRGQPRARLEDRRKDAGGGAVVVLLFRIITELPLSSFCKLLSNFIKKMKISKNESCSTFQTLQLCLSEHFQILSPFLNLNLGCI